jgi:uncharacterized membrane protein YfhO
MYLPIKQRFDHPLVPLNLNEIYDDYLNNSNVRPENFTHLDRNDFSFFANPQASITRTEFASGYPKMTIQANGEQVVTLPFISYSGYYLLVDGKKTLPVRLDSGLVGVKLGDGEHLVTLAYRTRIVMVPALISVLSLGVILVFFSRRQLNNIDGHRPNAIVDDTFL